MKFKRILSIVLSCALMLPVTAGVFGTTASAAGGLTLTDLKVCSTDIPFGVGETPEFSWKLDGDGFSRSQSAYRIIVASSVDENGEIKGNGDVWDSGKIESDKNYDIVYAGSDLSPKTTYYWKVTVWDEKGVSTTSGTEVFSTGIFEDDQWQGKWIGEYKPNTDINMTGANWIWGDGSNGTTSSAGGFAGGYQYFRKTVTPAAGKTVASVMIAYTADDRSELYVNGQACGNTEAWGSGGLYDATALFTSGSNVIAISGFNDSDGYAGMISKTVIEYTDGSNDTYVTDSSWKVGVSLQNNWYAKDFDDSAWVKPRQLVSYGSSPWGTGVNLSFSNSRAALMLRKEFNVENKAIKEAYAYVCGLGFFEMKINGQLPDDSVMNPCNTQYNKTVLYRTFPVTDLLKAGKNAIGVELGNSFYNDNSGVWNWPGASWRDDPKLLLNLEIKYEDGTSEIIASDTDWMITKEGPTVKNGIYYGETYDARLEQTGYDTVGFDESGWKSAAEVKAPDGELVCQTMDPVRRTDEFTAERIEKLGSGSYVIYTPQMVTGWIKLMNINEEAGTKITITYGEKLEENGTVQRLGGGDGVNGHWWPDAYIQQDNYICKGAENESFEPKFSYKGFQYVQIDGMTGELTADDIVIYRTANDVDRISTFETSNSLLNSLHFIMNNTMLNNFQGKPTDTPLWEKNGWLGDSNVSLKTMFYNFDMSNYLPNFVEIMEDCFEEFGSVPNMVPTAGSMLGNSAVWNTIYIFGVEKLVSDYGDISYLEEQYDSMRQFAIKDISEIRGNGWIWHDGQLSDWCSPVGGSDPNVNYTEADSEGSKICGTGFVYLMLDSMKQLAEKLGKTADAAEYDEAMKNIYNTFHKTFYNEAKGIYETGRFSQIGTRTQYRQTSNLVPLAWNLVPEDCVDTVVGNLVKDIEEKNYHLDTGVVGTMLILPTLCKYGREDVAFKIVTQTTYPSWGYWVSEGSTSTWEMWERTSRSLGHFFLGTYDEWFYSYLAGIKDMTDGYETFTIEPGMIGDLSYVNTTIDTVRGKLTSDWSLNDDGTATMNVTVPVGSTATIYFPTEQRTGVTLNGKTVSSTMDGVVSYSVKNGKACAVVESGSYTFTSATDLTSVYKDSLADAIAEVEKISTDGLPADIAEALTSSLDAAKKVYADASAVQKKVSDSLNALEAALTLYNGSEARRSLNTTVAEYKAKNVNLRGYTAETAAAYESALLTAEKLVKNYLAGDSMLYAAESQLKSAYNGLMAAGGGNVARGGNVKVTASSNNESPDWGWSLSRINDGDVYNINKDNEYTGYCSNNNPGSNHSEWVKFDLGGMQRIDNVTVYPSCVSENGKMVGYGMPVDLRIEVSSDDSNWQTVFTKTDCPLPEAGPQSFDFAACDARYVRFTADSLRPKTSDGNSYRLQLSEVEIYSVEGGEDKFEALTYLEIENGVMNELFSIDKTEYTATVSGEADSIVLTPYATAGAEITVNGTKVTSGSKTAEIPLNSDKTVITIAAAGRTTTLTVTKAQSFIPGDVDGNGTVNVSDILSLKTLIMNNSWTAEQLARGDMNSDGTLTVGDMLSIKNIIMAG